MSWSLRALKRFSNKVGKYPYDHLDVAETPAGTGMESHGYDLGRRDTDKSRFPYIVVHEMSHQWFYSGIGNNQLAAVPRRGHVEPDPRPARLVPTAHLRQGAPRSTRLGLQQPLLQRVIYVQGGLYLRNYRNKVGDNRFWDGMRNYFLKRKFEIGNTRDFLDTLMQRLATKAISMPTVPQPLFRRTVSRLPGPGPSGGQAP